MSLRGRSAGISSPVLMDRYLIASVGAIQVAFSAETVDGLLTVEESDPLGTVTVQGQVYTSVDLAARLGFAMDKDGPETRLILLAQGTARASVRVASIHGLLECERKDLLPLPHQFRGEERGWYGGLLLLSEGVSVVLRTQWLLSEVKTASSSGTEVKAFKQPVVSDLVPGGTERGLLC